MIGCALSPANARHLALRRFTSGAWSLRMTQVRHPLQAERVDPARRTQTHEPTIHEPLTDPRLKIAVFIDFDNIEIGVKTTLGGQFDIGLVLEAIKERGEVVTKIAYGDWKRAGDYSRLLSQHAIRMVQRNLTPGGDKNGADINLALDALEMAFTHDHINAFVIVGGDSDFISLVEKLKQYDRKVFVVGGRQFTSPMMQQNCHEFIAYENLARQRRTASSGGSGGRGRSGAPAAPAASRRREGAAAGEARAEGAGRPRGHAAARPAQEHAAAARLDVLRARLRRRQLPRLHREGRRARAVTLKQAGRSMLVELADNAVSAGVPDTLPPAPVADVAERPSRPRPGARDAPPRRARNPAEGRPRPGDPGQALDGSRRRGGCLSRRSRRRAGRCHIRQVRQYLRAADETFDERKFGFAGSSSSCARARRKGCCGSTATGRACCAMEWAIAPGGGIRVVQIPSDHHAVSPARA